MAGPCEPGIWSRNLSEQFKSESKRFKLIEKQKQLIEAKKSRQQQVAIVSTRPKSARNSRPGSSLSKSSDKISDQNEKGIADETKKFESTSKTPKVENSSSFTNCNENDSNSSSPEISPIDSPKVSRLSSSFQKSGKSGQIIRSKSSGDLKEDVEIIRDLEVSDKIHELNPLKSMLNVSETLLFATQQVPPGKTYQCLIIRDKRGIDRSFYPSYYIHLQAIIDNNLLDLKNENQGDSLESKVERQRSADSVGSDSRIGSSLTRGRLTNRRQVFLLAGRRRKKSKTYLIGNDPFDITRDNCVAKLKSNVLGTQFNAIQTSSDGRRYEVATIIYETNVLGFKGPRKMTVLIPKNEEACVYPNINLMGLWKNDVLTKESRSIITLKNKTPVWNDDTQSYVLNFHGRVTQASVKNFQLAISDRKVDSTQILNMINMKSRSQNTSSPVRSSSASILEPSGQPIENEAASPPLGGLDEDIAVQFGRISEKEFTCDVAWPLSILQAFCIALSSFDSKLACE